MTSKAVRLTLWCFFATSLLASLFFTAPATSLSGSTSSIQPSPTPVLAEQFLGRPYLANTLGGGLGQPETLTLRLDGFDCFTFLDTLEAMRRVMLGEQGTRLHNTLRQVRYHNAPGEPISWETRNHFFTDWAYYSPEWIRDVTRELGQTRQVSKTLNRNDEDEPWLLGIPEREVTLDVLSPQALDLSLLQSGDYLGIYTELDGLDVTHVGLVVKAQNKWYFRHASSRYGRVLDEVLTDYIKNKPGLIVFRPQNYLVSQP